MSENPLRNSTSAFAQAMAELTFHHLADGEQSDALLAAIDALAPADELHHMAGCAAYFFGDRFDVPDEYREPIMRAYLHGITHAAVSAWVDERRRRGDSPFHPPLIRE